MTRVRYDSGFDDVEEPRKRFEDFPKQHESGHDSQKNYGGLPRRSRDGAA
jgi:hypothetical protein